MALKIKYAFLTTEADEVDAIENLKAGYNLGGSDFDSDGHTIDTDDNIDSTAFAQAYVDEQINFRL